MELHGLVQLVRQLLAKGNEVHATARSSNNALSKLSDKVQVGQLDVSDPTAIKVSPCRGGIIC